MPRPKKTLKERITSAVKAFSWQWSRDWDFVPVDARSHTLDFYGPLAEGTDAARVGDPLCSSLIAAAVNWFGTVLPEAPIQVAKRKDVKVWDPLPDHPLVELINAPNPYYSGEMLWKAFASDWLVDGNVYWIKSRNASGQVVELWYAPAGYMTPKWEADSKEFISSYDYSFGGKTVRYAPEDVVHFRYGLDPRNPRLGLSPIKSLFREILTDQEAASYSVTVMSNFGVPPYFVAPKNSDFEVDVEKVKQSIVRRTTGSERGKPLIFEQPFEMEKMGISPDQMAVEKIRRIPEERVAAVIGIPIVVLGFGAGLEHSHFSNMRMAQEYAYENFIIPTQRVISSEVGRQMLRDFESKPENFRVIFDLSVVRALQEDRDALFKREVEAYRFGVKKRSESRSALGLESSGEDDVYFVQPLPPGQMPALPGSLRRGNQGEIKRVFEFVDEAAVSNWWDDTAPDAAVGLLEAEEPEDEVDLETASPEKRRGIFKAALAVGLLWLWDRKRRRFVSTVTGRVMRLDTLKRTIIETSDNASRELEKLARRLSAGETTSDSFQLEMNRKITLSQRAMAAAAFGGLAQMTQAKWSDTRQLVQDQIAYLARFESEIVNGRLSDAEITNRAGLYGQALYSNWANSTTARERTAGTPFARRVLDQGADHCDECPELAERGFVPIDEVVPIGDTPCKIGCRCSIEYGDESAAREGAAA